MSLIFASEPRLWRFAFPATDSYDFPSQYLGKFWHRLSSFVFRFPLAAVAQPDRIKAHVCNHLEYLFGSFHKEECSGAGSRVPDTGL